MSKNRRIVRTTAGILCMLCIISGLILSSCSVFSQNDTSVHAKASAGKNVKSGSVQKKNSKTKKESKKATYRATMKVYAANRNYVFHLEKNRTAQAFQRLAPVTLKMHDLNGNEKYCYLKKDLPSDDQRVTRIKAGDVMLYDHSCIVIFYKSFKTQYSYTRIGHIEPSSGLDEAFGSDSLSVRIK